MNTIINKSEIKNFLTGNNGLFFEFSVFGKGLTSIIRGQHQYWITQDKKYAMITTNDSVIRVEIKKISSLTANTDIDGMDTLAINVK